MGPGMQVTANVGVRRERLGSVLGWSSVVATIAPLLVVVLGKGLDLARPAWFGEGFVGGMIALGIALGIAATSMLGRRDAAGSIAADASGFTVVRGGATRRVPAADVVSAVTIPAGTKARIELTVRGGETISAEVPSEDDARAVLSSAGFGPERVRSRVALSSAGVRGASLFAWLCFALAMGPTLLPIGAASATGMVAWLAIVLAALAATLRMTRAPDVVVGADGFTIEGAKKRFVPFAGLASVSVAVGARHGLALRWADGRSERIDLYRLETPWRGERVQAIVARIRAAMAARASAEGAPEALRAALDRNGRTVGAWRDAIAGEVRRGAGYRSATAGPEDLGRILEGADTPADRRIGAALALAASKDPEAAPKIRVAAAACAEPRVRVALEKVAEGAAEGALDEEAIEEALAEGEARV